MKQGLLYFVSDEFYEKYEKYGLLFNKDIIDGQEHGRPCCYMFEYMNKKWMIPVSSQIEKYEQQYQHSINKYGICDNISFGYILGGKSAFLPQNLFPITDKYILNVYINKDTNKPISISKDLMSELNKKARKKIRYNLSGKRFGLSDIKSIINELDQEE